MVAFGMSSSAIAADKTVAGIVVSQLEYLQAFQHGIEVAAKKEGVVLLMANSDAKPEKEATLIDTHVARGVKAIVISPVSDKGSLPALQRASDKGVKIILYNSPLAADFPAAAIVCSDKQIGEGTGGVAAKFIADKLGGKAKIAPLGLKSLLPEQSEGRTNGFLGPVMKSGTVDIVSRQDAWTP